MKKTITLFSLFIASFTAAHAQIPNSDFESWTPATGYSTPDGWDNVNALTSSGSVYTCEKGTTTPPSGTGFLMLTSKTFGTSVAPGVAVCGKLDPVTKKPKSGFPFTGRPLSLTGKWQYMANGADAGAAGIYLTKWNGTAGKRDTVAHKIYNLPGMVMSWASFAIALDYQSSATPDTATIAFTSSNVTPVNGSYLYLDSLNFSGTAAGIGTTIRTIYQDMLYPNPAKGSVSMDFGHVTTADVFVNVTDLFGKLVKSQVCQQGKQVYTMQIGDMVPGMYFVKMQQGEDTQTQRLVIQ